MAVIISLPVSRSRRPKFEHFHVRSAKQSSNLEVCFKYFIEVAKGQTNLRDCEMGHEISGKTGEHHNTDNITDPEDNPAGRALGLN